jgi:hypothetical protein
MLNKKTLNIGDHVVVNDIIKDGVPANLGGGETKPFLSLFTGMVGGMRGGELSVVSGETLIIVKKPRRVGGINLCKVKRVLTDTEGEVYWCELRASCRPA